MQDPLVRSPEQSTLGVTPAMRSWPVWFTSNSLLTCLQMIYNSRKVETVVQESCMVVLSVETIKS
jgi:hypothetical protein